MTLYVCLCVGRRCSSLGLWKEHSSKSLWPFSFILPTPALALKSPMMKSASLLGKLRTIGPSNLWWSIASERRHTRSWLHPLLLSFARSGVSPSPCRALDGGQERVVYCKAHTVYPLLVSSLPLPEERVVLFAQGSVICQPCFLQSGDINTETMELSVDHCGLP